MKYWTHLLLAFLVTFSSTSFAQSDCLIRYIDSYKIPVRTRGISRNIPPTREQINANAALSKDDRLKEALRIIDRGSLNLADQLRLQNVIEEAHKVGRGGIYEYTWPELRQKYRILTEGGFSKAEADDLLRYGIAGRPPLRAVVVESSTRFGGHSSDLLRRNFLERRAEMNRLISENYPNPSGFRAIFDRQRTATTIQENIDSLYFIDYAHSSTHLNSVLRGEETFGKINISDLYSDDAFKNFRNTREHLLTTRPEFTRENFLDTHRRMMAGNIDRIPEERIGVTRQVQIWGNIPPNLPISAEIRNTLLRNPYLSVKVREISLNPTVIGPTNRLAGALYYPHADYIRPQGLDIIRRRNPTLVREIEAHQAQGTIISDKIQEYHAMAASPAKDALKLEIDRLHADTGIKIQSEALTKRLVDEMLDERLAWFNQSREALGTINTPEKLDKFVDLLATLQRDVVSIHPVADGNGRTTREFFLSYALMREGFPPPRIIDPNADIYRSLEEWKVIIKDGIESSDRMVADLTERMRVGLPIDHSTELLTPYLPPAIVVQLRNGSSTKLASGGTEYIDPRVYREIVRREMASNPALAGEIREHPIAAWERINERVSEFHSRNNIYYRHEKKGLERLEIGFVDEDFRTLFGRPSFNNREVFDFKMRSWYSDDVVWRGLASTTAEKTETEILDMFKNLSAHNASNAVVRSGARTPEAIREAALRDFDRYNEDVFGQGLVQMAKDHSETGPLYANSYGFSTSVKRDVGKAFAMGAMVVGPYGSHQAPELQAMLRSRVLVGARRSVKDVDLARLRQLRPEFSYKYGRQQEVMGVGASDPDSISIIQTIDDKGEVILSYLRNKNNPAEIFVVRGNIGPDDVPTRSQIVRTVTLTASE